jgi:hypothetical protein
MNLREAITCFELKEAILTMKLVKTAYHRLMFQWHPDRFSEAADIRVATQKAQELNRAYEVLSDYFASSATYPRGMDATSWAGEHRSRKTASRATQQGETQWERRFWRDSVEHGFPDEHVFEVFFFSSHLVSAGYSARERILYQKFHNGGGQTVVYRYFNVPKVIWDGLLMAESHGRFANQNINYSFRYECCHEPNRPYKSFAWIEAPRT